VLRHEKQADEEQVISVRGEPASPFIKADYEAYADAAMIGSIKGMSRILLIDDNEMFLQTLREAVKSRRSDLYVDTAWTPEGGLLLIGMVDYSVIISDVRCRV